MKLVWIFVSIGGIIGGYLPTLFGQNPLSVISILCGAAGSFFGIWVYTKLDLGQ